MNASADFLGEAPLVGLSPTAARVLEDPSEACTGPLVLRAQDDEFWVDEVPLYGESGEGEHLYLHLRKRGISTPDLVRRLCRHYGLKEVEVGLAGRKDARGITSQRVSVPARKVEGREHEVSTLGDIEVLGAKRHGNKLRLGHLAGNRFTVRVMGDVDVALLTER
ncbi:MAG: tRNA pseudouridine(13) synthase TruD, partial [Myxococcota bacterium]